VRTWRGCRHGQGTPRGAGASTGGKRAGFLGDPGEDDGPGQLGEDEICA
jgi:hypothetical protein